MSLKPVYNKVRETRLAGEQCAAVDRAVVQLQDVLTLRHLVESYAVRSARLVALARHDQQGPLAVTR